MIFEGNIFKIILAPHISEKSSLAVEKCNVVVLKVAKNSTKFAIKTAIKKLFSVTVKKVNILVIKGKNKRLSTGRISHKSDWKKAYVTLKEGQRLNFLGIQK
ncbi:50S ribosomal protein L23 [Buchnera aphidicola (Nipponaphis monzeni)]|uniref:Large ribosomal subunit protein uL23 n=1 Tax=Buchnera aphidicola (Nipponaphis monzeni) TaxID=2495405 RepID=A0A455TAP2_9GAMM|nr:50S ribosomal protein L23 [Buchnera aphidicola]BBI01399.1 50S ribosomal protein L23 [Buchnera aphidicola (Nipponaphis monzeni)]